MSRCAVTIGLFALFLGSVGNARAASGVAQDIRDLRQMKTWRASTPSLGGGPDATPDRVCGIENPGGYEVLRLDMQLAPGLSDSAATAQIAAFDHKIGSFLTDRGWSPIKVSENHGGIPDLTRCSGKQGTVAQIYKTTGRCTMNSPCTAYDGYAVVLYLPTNLKKNGQKP